MRLKRNNYVKQNQDHLSEDFYIKNFLPKLESVLQENALFLNDIQAGRSVIEISSYNPIDFEMNITPVMDELLNTSSLQLNHSLPIVVKEEVPLIFREYKRGDEMVKSELFKVFEPKEDKKQVYPQVLVIPLMGFMEDCHRIGYGGGFYDRTIQ